MDTKTLSAETAISWERMQELRILNITPFELVFSLEYARDLGGDLVFGVRKVVRFEADSPVIFVDGGYVMVESAEAVYVSVRERS